MRLCHPSVALGGAGPAAFNNRQGAIAIWLGVALVACLIGRGTRSALGDVVRAASNWMLLVSLVVLLANVTLACYLGHRAGLWHQELIGDTVFWFAAVALVQFVKLPDAATDRQHFRRSLRRAFEVGAVVDVVVNLKVFALGVELILQPLLASLIGVSVVAGWKQETQRAKVLVDRMLGGLGLFVIARALFVVVPNWASYDDQAIRQFVLPIWLIVAVLPLLYTLSLLMNYQSTLIRIWWRRDVSWRVRWRVNLAIICSLGVNTYAVGSLRGEWLSRLSVAATFRAARTTLRDYRASLEVPQVAAACRSD